MKILRFGKLYSNVNEKQEDYYIIKLSNIHFEQLMKLQTAVMESMERRDLYAGLTVGEIDNMLIDDGGLMVGAFVGDVMIAFYGIYFPGDNEDNLGRDVGIPKEDYHNVMHLEGAGVHPYYRGNSLQKILNSVCVAEAMKIRPVEHVCATVSPYNYASLDHLFAAKLYIKDMKKKYGDMLRYICYRNLCCEKEIIHDSIINVESSDFNLQSKLLSERFIGFKIINSNKRCFIDFAKTK